MGAIASVDLYLDTYCDFFATWTWFAGDQPVNFQGATAQAMIRATSVDVVPLLALSTTPGPTGYISLGIAAPGPFTALVADLSGLAAYGVSGLVAGNMVEVLSPDSFYGWAPGNTLPADGVNVVASTSGLGNWLLTATIALSIPNAAMLPLVGTVQAGWDLVITWANGQKSKVFAGAVYVDQTETHP